MKQIRKFKKVSAAAVIGKLRNEFIQKEQENPLEDHFSQAKQDFVNSYRITRSRKPIVKRIKLARIIAHMKRVDVILDAGEERNKDQVCEF